MANYASTVIAVAKAEVGYLEKKSNKNLDSKTANAGSANYTKYGRDMHELYPSVMDFPAAWCDAFVDWCFQTAYGVSNAKGLLGGNFNDYTPSSAQLYKNKGAYGKTPKLGAQIFFKNSKRICHTGIVVGFDKTYVYTIEGNTSGASGVIANGGGVCEKKYKLTNSKIDGYGYPKYDPEPETITTVKPEEVTMKQIKKGSKGKAVKVWQAILGIDIDGIFGTGTRNATIAFQKKAFPNQPGEWDGVVGAKTWKAGLESVK